MLPMETTVKTRMAVMSVAFLGSLESPDPKQIKLTNTEFKLLTILLGKRGWVFSRDSLLDKIWGEEKYVIDRTIDVHVKNLREKLGDIGKLIKNIRGVGYKLDSKK